MVNASNIVRRAGLAAHGMEGAGALRETIDGAGRGTPARADATIAPHLAGKTVRKVICVPGKLLNFVVG